MAVVSSRKPRLQQRAEEGDRGAVVALALAEDPGRFLSTVQVGITLVGILAGAFAGATLAETLASRLETIGVAERFAGTVAVAVVVIGVGYLSLIVGELVPKRIALAHPETLACRVARPMRVVSRIGSPVVSVLSFSTDTVLRVIGMRPRSDGQMTEEELHLLLEQGAQEGVIEHGERAIAAAALKVGDLSVGDRMTPRPQLDWLDVSDSLETNLEKMVASSHDRFLLCRESPDDVLGIVVARDALADLVRGGEIDLPRLARPPLYLPDSLQLLPALERMKNERVVVAVVVDEFGGTSGLVTINDLIEPIIGQLPSEENDGPMVVERADGSFLIDARLSTDALKTILGVKSLPGVGEYQTLAGFVLHRLQHLPTIGERFTWESVAFEVVDLDGQRIDKMLVTRAHPPPAGT